MAIGTHLFKCNTCDYSNEYCLNYEKPPKKCPQCKKGKIERQFTPTTAFDLIGAGFYINDYGKKAWKKNLTNEEASKVLTENKNPY